MIQNTNYFIQAHLLICIKNMLVSEKVTVELIYHVVLIMLKLSLLLLHW